MEFPNLGDNCSMEACNKLDFLPVRCDGCKKIYCREHMTYNNHNCPSPKLVNKQVAVCPLCNKPVPSKSSKPPDVAVSAHIDRDCESDPALKQRKVFANKCMMKGCKRREVVPVVCRECGSNFCLIHRHPTDHKCTKSNSNHEDNADNKRPPRNIDVSSVQGNMSEDEALAHALALSMDHSLGMNSRSNTNLSNGPSRSQEKSMVNSNCTMS